MTSFASSWTTARQNVAQITDRQWLLSSSTALYCVGLIMVSSASMGVAEANYGSPFYFLIRHAIYLLLGLGVGLVTLQVPTSTWQRYSYPIFLLALLLIIIVLIPGIGRRVNGSMRWIGFGGVTIQPSEVMKLAAIVAMSMYLVRQQEAVKNKIGGYVRPIIAVFMVAMLLLLEPDFGATVVISVTMLAMLFLAGSPLKYYIGFTITIVVAAIGLMLLEPYRVQRLIAFKDPWADQYNSGYQLVQSLIAFGRGDWFGVGLGHSVQKLFYLPEAHTDFVFAIFAEEFGLVGVLVLIATVLALVLAGIRIGQRAERLGQMFSAYIAYGISIMLAFQSAINIGVNIGLLPTKGLTLPLVSYGGSSLLVSFAMIGLLLRIDAETSAVPERVRRPAFGVQK